MIAGRFAFQGASDYMTWQKIKKLEYDFPPGFDEQAKDLVQKLLVCAPVLMTCSLISSSYVHTGP